jgi:hypothetical protein
MLQVRMSVQNSSWSAGADDLPAVSQSGSSVAFLRVREMLRIEGELTIEQFHELDRLFHTVSQAQFVTLTEDPLHQAGLRRYEALSWRQGRPAALVASVLMGIGATAVTLLLLLLR